MILSERPVSWLLRVGTKKRFGGGSEEELGSGTFYISMLA